MCVLGGVCTFLQNLVNSQFHVADRCVLGGVSTFLQNLVNSQFYVADSGVFLEVSVPFCRTW